MQGFCAPWPSNHGVADVGNLAYVLRQMASKVMSAWHSWHSQRMLSRKQQLYKARALRRFRKKGVRLMTPFFCYDKRIWDFWACLMFRPACFGGLASAAATTTTATSTHSSAAAAASSPHASQPATPGPASAAANGPACNAAAAITNWKRIPPEAGEPTTRVHHYARWHWCSKCKHGKGLCRGKGRWTRSHGTHQHGRQCSSATTDRSLTWVGLFFRACRAPLSWILGRDLNPATADSPATQSDKTPPAFEFPNHESVRSMFVYGFTDSSPFALPWINLGESAPFCAAPFCAAPTHSLAAAASPCTSQPPTASPVSNAAASAAAAVAGEPSWPPTGSTCSPASAGAAVKQSALAAIGSGHAGCSDVPSEPPHFACLSHSGKTQQLSGVTGCSTIEDTLRAIREQTGLLGRFQLWVRNANGERHLVDTSITLVESSVHHGDTLVTKIIGKGGAGKGLWRLKGNKENSSEDDNEAVTPSSNSYECPSSSRSSNRSSSNSDCENEPGGSSSSSSSSVFNVVMGEAEAITGETVASMKDTSSDIGEGEDNAMARDLAVAGTGASRFSVKDGDRSNLSAGSESSPVDAVMVEAEAVKVDLEEKSLEQFCQLLIEQLTSSHVSEKDKQQAFHSLHLASEHQTSVCHSLLTHAADNREEARKLIAMTFDATSHLETLHQEHEEEALLPIADVPCAMASLLFACCDASWKNLAVHPAWAKEILPKLEEIMGEGKGMDSNKIKQALHFKATMITALFLPSLSPLENDLPEGESSNEPFSLFAHRRSLRVTSLKVKDRQKKVKQNQEVLPFQGAATVLWLFGNTRSNYSKREGFQCSVQQKHVLGILKIAQDRFKEHFLSKCYFDHEQLAETIPSITRGDLKVAEKEHVARQRRVSANALSDEDVVDWLNGQASLGCPYCGPRESNSGSGAQCPICAKKASTKTKKRPDVFRQLLKHHCMPDKKNVYLDPTAFRFICDSGGFADQDQRLVAASIAYVRCAQEFNWGALQ